MIPIEDADAEAIEGSRTRPPRAAPWLWPLLPVAAAAVAVRGAFSTTSIFYIRDMAGQYWPMHRWFTATVASGQSLLWDPYPAFGHSAIAEPPRHLLFPPVLALRLLLPDVIGFNLSVALPFPLAALGMYLFLRGHASRPAAALGATVFAISGPVLSTGNFLNMSWAVAAIPYVLHLVDRLAAHRSARGVALLALAFGLQLLAGEPVTLAGTAALALGYAAAGAPLGRDGLRARAALVLATAVSQVGGALLGAAQVLPLVDAVGRSVRDVLTESSRFIGALHPLLGLDAVAPGLFGDWIECYFRCPGWLYTLNAGYEPIFYSIYIGVGALTLALVGALAGPSRRWAVFWIVVAGISVLFVLGPHTPVYPAVARLPILRTFRFPVKYSVHAVVAVAALASVGWDALAKSEASRRARVLAGVPAAVAATAAVALVALLAAPEPVHHALVAASEYFAVSDPEHAAGWLVQSLALQLPRLAALLAASAALVWVAGARPAHGRVARGTLFFMIVLDLVATNSALNPTVELAQLGEPRWVEATRDYPHDRIYIRPRVLFPDTNNPDIDATPLPRGLSVSELPDMAILARRMTLLAEIPEAYRLRDTITDDLYAIWPREYRMFERRFHRADRDERLRFLERVGTRFFLLTTPPPPEARPVASVPEEDAPILYERAPAMSRAAVVASAEVEPDLQVHVERMFAADFDPSASVLLAETPPAPAGVPGEPQPAGAEIVEDGTAVVAVRTTVGSPDGYLLLTDGYDPNWRVTVDGAEAPLLRADGMFRAVRLSSGAHTVRFEYWPRPFWIGLGISLAAAAAIVAACVVGRRRQARPSGPASVSL